MEPHIQRNSSVELLKIIAMFLIVISHVAQTLGSPHPELSYPAECFFDSMHTAHDIQHFLILVFRHFGVFGNNLFFYLLGMVFVRKQENADAENFQDFVRCLASFCPEPCRRFCRRA